MDLELQIFGQKRSHVLSDICSMFLQFILSVLISCKELVLLGFLGKVNKKKLTEVGIYVLLLEIISTLVDFLGGGRWPLAGATFLLATSCFFLTIYDFKKGSDHATLQMKILGITFATIQLLDNFIFLLFHYRINGNLGFLFTLAFSVIDVWFVLMKKGEELPCSQQQIYEPGSYAEPDPWYVAFYTGY